MRITIAQRLPRNIPYVIELTAKGAIMDLLACEPTQIKETLKEQGVRFCFSGYVDLHGRLKGKIVPLSLISIRW